MNKKQLAKDAQQHFKNAVREIKRANDIFKQVGDKSGEKVASDAEEAANKGDKYVEERLK